MMKSSIFCVINILTIFVAAESAESYSENDVVEKFYWTPNDDSGDEQWEFSVIGKRVTWQIGAMLCSTRDSLKKLLNHESVENTLIGKNPMRMRRNQRSHDVGGLAVLDRDNMAEWLSRMLSESNYQYDGLWIGGRRKNSKTNWTWIVTEAEGGVPIESSSISSIHPEWYKLGNVSQENSKNCLTFEKIGHNLPLLVPTDCQLRKPFVCSRIVAKNSEIIVDGTSLSVDGFRYTLFSVDEGEEMHRNAFSGVRRLNGGGVKWNEARIECRKRGQYFAMIMSNKAAKKIASLMLKNRPSIESVWLGGWSPDGIAWKWSATGQALPSTQSSTSQYPPWLTGHPVSTLKIDNNYQNYSRCLILDRHLCPEHISPVFLDLDCEKKRPFVCQDGIPNSWYNQEISEALENRRIIVDDQVFEFSAELMTWNEGATYCLHNNGRIASIVNSKILSMVLDRMSNLYIDHIWVGGRTVKTHEGWKWIDESENVLTPKEIGLQTSWCLDDDVSTSSKTDSDHCLNLDREGHALPLFYGLPCNVTRQHVLCSFNVNSTARDEFSGIDGKKNSSQLAKLEGFFF